MRNVHLASQQNVLFGLRHRAVSSSNHQDCAVHLGGTGDHVLDVVGVTRAVDVSVVTASVSYSTCDGVIVIPRALSSGALSMFCVIQNYDPTGLGEDLRDRSGERSLAVVT